MSVQPRLALAPLACAGCLGGITTGAVAPLTSSGPAPTGVELRMFGATGVQPDDPLLPNAFGVAFRQIGDEHVTTASQIGWAGALPLGHGAVFGRLMVDLLSSQRTSDHDRKYSAFSPTLDLGIAPYRNGLCFSLSASYDVHFGDPDRVLVGAFVGLCASDRMRR